MRFKHLLREEISRLLLIIQNVWDLGITYTFLIDIITKGLKQLKI